MPGARHRVHHVGLGLERAGQLRCHRAPLFHLAKLCCQCRVPRCHGLHLGKFSLPVGKLRLPLAKGHLDSVALCSRFGNRLGFGNGRLVGGRGLFKFPAAHRCLGGCRTLIRSQLLTTCP
ncbi:hypothetical protein D9M68_913540 [compost metagenome]